MIALRSEFAAYSRRADVRIGLLKEVIERVQRGEDVDVEGLLGTGNKAKEKEWEEVLREIEEEDKQWQSRAKKSREDSNVPGEASAISKSSDAHIKDFGEPDRVPLDDGTTTKKSGPGHPRFY
ncbi:MAG: hypothetical protein M1832_002256 [Thelocarpon impressellum]|nr:MAG: hypothetical protein M1832_002256 [Thelocarpon impressellum]